MEQGRLLKNTVKLLSILQDKLNSPLKLSQGGSTQKALAAFNTRMAKEYGELGEERLTDFIIFAAYNRRNSIQPQQANVIFGPTAISKFRERKHQQRYYEDLWLEGGGISRSYLLDQIRDLSQHPQAQYIYVEAEEPTKRRMLNQRVGYVLCQESTLGWSPLSAACHECSYINDCKRETQKNYPELYRLRSEYGTAK
jgi:molybdopterin converting factor small subunit